MKHTQAKWMVAHSGKCTDGSKAFEVVADKKYHGTMGTDAETPICKMYHMAGIPNEEIEANANLIASAPELLEVLNLIILNEVALEGEGKECNISGPVFLKALQVIKKATS